MSGTHLFAYIRRRRNALLRGQLVLARVVPCDAGSSAFDSRLDAFLGTDELRRADRFRFAEDRVAFVVAHALLRVMLSAVLPQSAPDWEFVTDELGRPLLRSGQSRHDILFSISHTRGLAACALGTRSEIGIDVEGGDAARLLNIDGGWLTSSEHAALNALTPEAREDAAVRLWTLKEAVAKAIGQGLGQRIGELGFVLDPPRFTRAPAGAGYWQLAQARPTPIHVVAVAVRSARRQSVQIAIESSSIDTMGAYFSPGSRRSGRG